MNNTILRSLLITVLMIVFSTSMAQAAIFKHESLIKIAGYPELSYFQPGNKDKPLVVFVAGGANLARLSYGIPGTNKKDFMAYWFHKKGYPFLGLSYPLGNPVFKHVYPEFNITSWAQQIVESAKNTIEKNSLSHTVIILGWSMAGEAVSKVNKIAAEKKYGLKIIYISLSSNTPTTGLLKSFPVAGASLPFDAMTNKPTAQGLSGAGILTGWFLESIRRESHLNGHRIISKSAYVKNILGDFPVALLGSGTYYGKHCYSHCFRKDIRYALKDTNAMDYSSYPMIGIIHGDMRFDYIYALYTKSDWSPMLVRSIYNLLSNNHKVNLNSLSKQQWKNFSKLINQAPQLLSKTVHGNHMFFLGEKGAKQTVTDVQALIKTIDQIKMTIAGYRRISKHLK